MSRLAAQAAPDDLERDRIDPGERPAWRSRGAGTDTILSTRAGLVNRA